MEDQIAQLAREGLANQEISAQLFIGRRTVEWHVRDIFTRLAITSRREFDTLSGRLSGPSGA